MSTLFTIQLKTLILVAAPAGTAAAFKMKRTDLMGLWWDQNDQLPTIGEYLNIPSVYHYVSILSPPSLSKFSRNGFPDVWQIILLCPGFGTFQPDIGQNATWWRPRMLELPDSLKLEYLICRILFKFLFLKETHWRLNPEPVQKCYIHSTETR